MILRYRFLEIKALYFPRWDRQNLWAKQRDAVEERAMKKAWVKEAAVDRRFSPPFYSSGKSGYSRGLKDANRPERPGKESVSDQRWPFFPGLFRSGLMASDRRPVSPVEPTVNNQGGSQQVTVTCCDPPFFV